jgi:hypothetical protein
MRESALARFFAGEEPAEVLRGDLVDIVGTNTLRVGQNLVTDLATDMEITPVYLIRLCDAFLAGELDAGQLEAIAFFLIGSDHFSWDTDVDDGALVAEVLFDWSAPAINYPLTRDNIATYRTGLTEGRYLFARNHTAR